MEREDYLKEQIESYIDQLDLLGMQENIDTERIGSVIKRAKELATEYIKLLDDKLESQIQGIEKRFVVTLKEELEKRQNIFEVVNYKLQAVVGLFGHVKEIEVAAEFWEYIRDTLKASESQAHEYKNDVQFVEEQFEKIKQAEEREAILVGDLTQAYIYQKNLNDSKISFATLDEEILDVYSKVLKEGNESQIDFSNVLAKEKALKKRRKQLLENLELARSAKDAEGYVKTYEERVKQNRLELDKIAEQKFLHLLKKIMKLPVDSYESLEKRTKTIQGLVSSRISQVKQLYQEGIAQRGEYSTLATEVDHSDIYEQLHNLEELEKNDNLINSLEEELKHTRDDIKGKQELELLFSERAKNRGRVAIVPEAPTDKSGLLDDQEEPEILFEDEEGYDDLKPEKEKKDKKGRRQIISIEPAKQSLLEKLGKVKNFLNSALETVKDIPGQVKERIEKLIVVPEKYHPAIGDQIELGENVSIFSDPMDIGTQKHGKEAREVHLTGTKLYVTRGVILDQTGTPIYITTDYGVDLENIAKDMKLESGSYNIALGCAVGDSDGKFIAVTDDELNPDIEKGWVNAADTNLIIVNQLNGNLKKGGMKK